MKSIGKKTGRPSGVESLGAWVMASAGITGFSFANAARNRDASTTSLFVSLPSVPPTPNTSYSAEAVCQASSAKS